MVLPNCKTVGKNLLGKPLEILTFFYTKCYIQITNRVK